MAPRAGQSGFALVEMLVAMVLLSLVGLTLARFQSFQLAGSGQVAAVAAARLEADNLAVDMLVQPSAPMGTEEGWRENGGRRFFWRAENHGAPDANMPDLLRITLAISQEAGSPPLATREIVRPMRWPAYRPQQTP